MSMTLPVSRLAASSLAVILAAVMAAPVAAQDATPEAGAMAFPISRGSGRVPGRTSLHR